MPIPTRCLALGLAVCALALPIQAIETDPALTRQLYLEEQELRAARAVLPSLFERAYARHPQIPAGVLEAIAYSQTRWRALVPETGHEAHHHMPPSWGVMGLYAGQGFDDQVGAAARLLGVERSQVERDDGTNILAAAALLEREIGANGVATLEDMAPVLARYAGFGAQGRAGIDAFARDSFAFDVLLALDRGIDDKGMVVPERPVHWERAFPIERLVQLRAPFVRLDVGADRIEIDGYRIDPRSETLVQEHSRLEDKPDEGVNPRSTDYGPAIWDPAHSSNYTASRSAAVSAVTIHTAQGTYAGTISWFKNASANVSAHYVIRSSDGQVTQMVREAHTGWHVRDHNSYTIGIEHEGYVNNSAWYTTSMYNASAALVRHFCVRYSGISCAAAYNGPAHSGVVVLPTTVRIKGHQHFSGNTHTDPGINWNWAHYYNLLNPGSGGTTTFLDRFESSVGHFHTSPTYSGSTVGISTASTAQRNCSIARNGNCSLQVRLVDNPNTSANWQVRLLSGAGTPANNVNLTRANGRIGFWVYSGGTGMSVAVGIDDSDGTERSINRSVPANQWTYVEWSLTDSAQWNAWVGGNGAITAGTVTLDAIWLFRAQTSFEVFVYIDDVQIRN